ncbi:hypothetical protein DB30_03464 [Enhygromyxa salina]|uniref:Uncharacterized protein n=1 Tax=Enhygromyxa salina TaxID=215803 RepID=A0A0C2D218_9BACT|nr:hypothetical protein DB30_03464 [Enhygromyxa salina]
MFASRDGAPCFVDRVGQPQDLDQLSERAGSGAADFDLLRLFVREPDGEPDDVGLDPYRGGDANERLQLQLAVDVELHRVVPYDGYPLRLRIHGLLSELRAGIDEPWEDLAKRTASYIERSFPGRRIHGHDDVPEEFRRRVNAIVAALSSKLDSKRIDRAVRSAIVVPRHPRMTKLAELPAPLGAGSFARLPRLEPAARYLFAWPEVHVGVSYEQMLVLDGRGRRMIATGPTPVVATGPSHTPENTLAHGVAPLHIPAPDLLAFSGHEWDAEARRELVLARDASCEGLDGCAALIKHERRKFDCGSTGPARRTSIGGGSGVGSGAGSGGGYPGELSF